MAEGVGPALVSAAQALYAAARANKRSEIHHRRQARTLMREFDLLRREAERHGIRIEIDTAPKEAKS